MLPGFAKSVFRFENSEPDFTNRISGLKTTITVLPNPSLLVSILLIVLPDSANALCNLGGWGVFNYADTSSFFLEITQ